ncbi:MAG: hypothetical protein AB7F79_06455 [Steroidobacteraceae bacterium]
MNVLAIIEATRCDGLQLSVSSGGKLKICGEAAKVDKWKPVLSEHKAGIVAILALDPLHANLTLRIKTMAARWRYTDSELASVLMLAAFDPTAWLQVVILDEEKFGCSECWPLQ